MSPFDASKIDPATSWIYISAAYRRHTIKRARATRRKTITNATSKRKADMATIHLAFDEGRISARDLKLSLEAIDLTFNNRLHRANQRFNQREQNT